MASVKLKLKKDKTLSDGSHPVIIQVIHNRRRKVFYLGFSALKSQWDENRNKPKNNHPEHQLIKSRAKNAILAIKTIKVEFVYKNQFSTQDQAKLSLFNWIETWYNRRRRHSALGYKTMEEFELANNNQRIAA